MSEGLAQGPNVAAIAGFEPTTLQTKGAESTNEPPHDVNHVRMAVVTFEVGDVLDLRAMSRSTFAPVS